MSGNTTEQRIGAQTEAAGKVRDKQAEFNRLVKSIQTEHEGLKGGYEGHGAASLHLLVNDWAGDAYKLIGEFEQFAAKLVQTDRTTAASQEEQAAQYGKAKTTFRTAI